MGSHFLSSGQSQRSKIINPSLAVGKGMTAGAAEIHDGEVVAGGSPAPEGLKGGGGR